MGADDGLDRCSIQPRHEPFKRPIQNFGHGHRGRRCGDHGRAFRAGAGAVPSVARPMAGTVHGARHRLAQFSRLRCRVGRIHRGYRCIRFHRFTDRSLRHCGGTGDLHCPRDHDGSDFHHHLRARHSIAGNTKPPGNISPTGLRSLRAHCVARPTLRVSSGC